MNLEVLDHVVLGNPWRRWLIALVIVLATTFLTRLLLHFVHKRLEAVANRTDNRIDDVVVHVIDATRWWLLLLVSLRPAAAVLTLSDRTEVVVAAVASVALVLQVGFWLQQAFVSTIHARYDRLGADKPKDETTQKALTFAGRLVLWSIVAILVMNNLGIEVTALVAGLGIGGVAAALAVQNVLGDLIASLSIYLDRPFDIGDFIIVGEQVGTVESVKWRTSRIRAISGEEIIFPNADLAKSRIHNYGRMSERRSLFEIGIEYNQPAEKLREAKKLIIETIEATEDVRFDRVHFKGFGDYALLYECVYWVLSPQYPVFMDKQEQINLGIYERFEAAGIPFAFPTRTLMVRQEETWKMETPPSSERRPRASNE